MGVNKLDILICTIDSRIESFNYLYDKLSNQISIAGLNDVGILFKRDNKQMTVGRKRNVLVSESTAEYACFVDDDDDISDDYVRKIRQALDGNPDCVSLNGIITFSGIKPQTFIHSIRYNSYFEKDGIYYRPPNHLNPIRRSISASFMFPEKNCGEDTDWAMQICRSGLLRTEHFVEEPYYFYKYDPAKTETQK